MAAIKIKTTTKVSPQCYAYTTPGVADNEGFTKIGYTERDVETRINEQLHTAHIPHKTWWHRLAMYATEPYGPFTDKNFHAYLQKLGVPRKEGTEWFEIDPNMAEKDFVDFTGNHGEVSDDDYAPAPYKLREEQEKAVKDTYDYFTSHEKGEYLWNAKPRFGKTLSAYDLCRRLDVTNVLIVTNRPAIANSWYSDYETFFGPSSGYVFVSHVDGIKNKKYVMTYEEYVQKVRVDYYEKIKGVIEFVSLQDLKDSAYFGGQHEKLGECSDAKREGRDIGLMWDLLIVDEAHEGIDTYRTDTAFNHIRRKNTLHLSGTPFKALANDKFPEEAIFNWTYADEQDKKNNWDPTSEIENPYANLPKLNLYTYQMSDIVRDKLKNGIQLADKDVEEYAFDLNEFFATDEFGKFIHDADVDKFLDALTRQEKFPFSTPELRDELKHTFWLLNRISSAKALAKKLHDHPVFKDYYVIPAFGDGKIDEDDEGTNQKSFDKVRDAIENYDKTITLSVGQLTTGVTIPEWTAVLMLSNMKSPALYMQAAFRAQNPCLFNDGMGGTYRKENAYVFDFDPARTLDIFERFANDLYPDTSGDKGDSEKRKENVRRLLNFFPVYGEDDEGQMIALDAEKVLTIPRHIHAKEVVERGFMSNFLFANISGIFGAPKEIIDIINGMQAIEEKKKLPKVDIDENTSEELRLNDKNEVEIPDEQVIGLEKEVFGHKVYEDVSEQIDKAVEEAQKDYEKNQKKDELKALKETFSRPMTSTLMETAKTSYGSDLKKSTENHLERELQNKTDAIVNREYGDYTINRNKLENERQQKVEEAQKQNVPMIDISKINEEYDQRVKDKYNDMLEKIQEHLHKQETIETATKTIVNTVETEKLNAVKDSKESEVRDHLRGFSRTIPAFLMAYGDETTTLANFDSLVPADVFWEVTVNPQTGKGVSLDQFRLLRDGGDYYETDSNGNEIRDEEHKKHFDGHLFDNVVFDDAVQEFMKKKDQLADYFDESQKGDIFDYIPPQKTNQIFTPKRVVKEMVDMLEQENPGCFDDPDATFADLYMKSGMYITEIVKRLYNSEKMKSLFPDNADRLNHIFAEQVYGCAPTEIIYRICLSYILGFSDEIEIQKNNIVQCDTLQFTKKGTLEMKLKELFPELSR